MTRNEFLQKLREALSNDLTGSVIQENVDYYNQYITDEVNNGRKEEDVINELGDPWVIAQTIIDTTQGSQNRGQSSYYEPDSQTYGQQRSTGGMGNSGGTKWWKVIMILLAVIVVLCVIVSVVGGIISLVAPVLVPVLIILFIVRLFGKKQ